MGAVKPGAVRPGDRLELAIEKGGRDDFVPVMEAVRTTRSLEYARERAEAEAQAACQGLARLADSPHRQSLVALADFAVTRNY